jgi:hypothetical protein
MERGDLGIEKYFTQLRIDKLPKGRVPKYKIGDLVSIKFTSDYCPTSSYILKDGVGLITEVLLYMCTDYDEAVKHENPTYVIEYKLIPAHRDSEIRYVSEQYLDLVETKND